ncbi:MAG: chitosanase [Deltaproteobacteria bacterium]|nr:chitosanase [Deltaproteobacteria bacterium]
MRICLLVALVACSGSKAAMHGDGPLADSSGDGAGSGSGSGGGSGALTANQKRVAEELTSIWENDTPQLDYAYSENIGDGRGYTSGRAGFCTGTGDAIQVIACYDAKRTAAQGNLMAKYMPALMVIDQRYQSTGMDQASTAELDAVGSWTADWAASDNNQTTQADFRACQDQIVDLLYYTPAMDAAAQRGLTTALTKAALYDMWINQGDDALAKKADQLAGPGATEDLWLQKFLEARRDVMWADSTWKSAVDRVAGYEKQRRRGNWQLGTAIRNDVRALDCWGAPYTSSGYTVREIAPDGTWTTPATSTYSCN